MIPGSTSWRKRVIEQELDPDVLLSRTPMHWADILFLDRPSRSRIIYNATVQTVSFELFGQLERMADEAVDSRLSDEDAQRQLNEMKFVFEPLEKGSSFTRMVFAKSPILASLGHKTRSAALSEELVRLANTPAQWPRVSPGATLDPGYRYGVGVNLVVDTPSLTVHGLIMAIDRFRAAGCKDYTQEDCFVDPTPIVRSMLLQQAYIQARMDAHDRDLPPPPEEAFLATVPDVLRPHLHCQSVGVRL